MEEIGSPIYLVELPLKKLVSLLLASAFVASSAFASDRGDDVARTCRAAEVFKQIMLTPDKAIPDQLVKAASCIAIIPGDEKVAFIFGGNYGRGLVSCRTDHGWSGPISIALDGSVGYQIGGSSTDIVMLFMNTHALQSLLSDKFKLERMQV